MNICKWEQLYKEHLDWAYRAKEEFIDSFEIDEFRDLFVFNNQNNKSNINVLVYGESQQGKTSFIFNLLGIKDKKLIEIFRAGSEQGNSATPTAMIYLRSEDENFHYKESKKYICLESENKLENKLIELKKNKVENKKSNITQVRIKIPGKYFTKENDFKINIIDLPGVGSRNDNEREHVFNIIHKLVPHANVILIVTSINNIVHIGSGDFKIPKIDDWRDFPERFRIILTHSGTVDSIRDKFNKKKISTKKEFRNYVEDEFKKSVENTPDKIKIYPIENKKENKVPKEIFDEIETELIEDINTSDTELGYLNRFSEYWKSLESIKKKKLNEFYSELEKKEQELKDVEVKIARIDESLEKCKKMKSEIENLKKLIIEMGKEKWVFNKKISEPVKRTAKELNKGLENSINNLKKDAKNFIRDFNKKFSKNIKNVLRNSNKKRLIEIKTDIEKISLENDEFVNIRKKLNKQSWLAKKIPKIFYRKKNYIRDFNNSSNAYNSIKKELQENINNQIEDIIIGLRKEIDKKENKLNSKKRIKDKLLEQFKEDRKRLLNEDKRKRKEKNIYEKIAQKDIQNAKKYKEKMLSAYKQEEKRIYDKINSSSSCPIDNFYFLMQLASENNEIIKIVGGINE